MFLQYLIDLNDRIGKYILTSIEETGSFALFGMRAMRSFINNPIKKRELVLCMYTISIQSLAITILTGSFAGLALALQAYIGFSRVHAEQFTGLVATLGIIRELGPVLTGLIISAKNGSSMAAEIGTMRITEQIDALTTLCIDPLNYIVVPRIVATSIMMPFITMFSMLFGVMASYFLCVYSLGINEQSYISIITEYVRLQDITGGIIKSFVFGFVIALVGTYKGYYTEGGARGVGIATTQAVVLGSMLILVINYILSSILYNTGLA